MKKVLLALLLASCMPVEDFQEPQVDPLDHVWVCYNPNSEWHGSTCNEECYWVGFERSRESFCWLLEKESCTGDLELQWQRENCHLLE